MAALHANLEKVRFLLGTWRGRGAGFYPTIKPFEYKEEITFNHVGKPFLVYNQKTSDATSGLPLHAECGYLRSPAPTKLELVLAQPSGVSSIELAEVDAAKASTIAFSCSNEAIVRTPTAKHPWVRSYTRKFELVDEDTLTYTMAMETETQHMQPHLTATLKRVKE